MKRKNFVSMSARKRFFKMLSYVIIIIITSLLQVCLFSRTLNLFSVTADVTFALVVAISLFEGEKIGSVFSVFASICLIIAGKTPIYYMTVLLISAYTVEVVSKKRGEYNILWFWIYLSCSLVLKGVVTLAFKTIEGVSFFGTIIYLLLPEFLSSMIFGTLFYFVAHLVSKIFGYNHQIKSKGDFLI